MKKSIGLLLMLSLVISAVILTGCGEPEGGGITEPEKDIVEEDVEKNPVYKLRLTKIIYKTITAEVSNTEPFEIEYGSEKTIHINETVIGAGNISFTVEGDATISVGENKGCSKGIMCTKYSMKGSETNGRGVTSELVATGVDSKGQSMGLDSSEVAVEFNGDAEGDRNMGYVVLELIEVIK